MSGDTVLIQDAMGEKVGKFIQLLSTFIGSFIVSFIQGWLLTLVMMATIPVIVLAAGAMTTVISRMASLGQKAYAEASINVEQTLGSIRTGYIPNGTWGSVYRQWKSCCKKLRKHQQCIVISIGSLSAGLCRHRAILFTEPSRSASLLGLASLWSSHQDHWQEGKDSWCVQETMSSCFCFLASSIWVSV